MRRVHRILKIRRRRRRRRKWLLRMVLKLKAPKRATTTLKTTVRKQKVVTLKRPTPLIHSKSPCEHCENSNVCGTLIMKCPKCFWHDYYKICPTCDHQIREGRNYVKEGFLRCHDCGAVTHKNAKTLETNFYSPSKEENQDED